MNKQKALKKRRVAVSVSVIWLMELLTVSDLGAPQVAWQHAELLTHLVTITFNYHLRKATFTLGSCQKATPWVYLIIPKIPSLPQNTCSPNTNCMHTHRSAASKTHPSDWWIFSVFDDLGFFFFFESKCSDNFIAVTVRVCLVE